MVTLVICEDRMPQDWKLVEPFLFTGNPQDELVRIQLTDAEAQGGMQVADKVCSYLRSHNVERWQLVWLLDIPPTQISYERFAIRYRDFQEQVVASLAAHRMSPSSIFVLTLDQADQWGKSMTGEAIRMAAADRSGDSYAPAVLIRIPGHQSLPAKRARALLSMVYALRAISLHQPSAGTWQAGSTYRLAVEFDESEAVAFLGRYMAGLYVGKRQLEQLLIRRQFELLPIYAAGSPRPFGREAPNRQAAVPPAFRYRKRKVYMETFEEFEENAARLLDERDQAMVREATTDMKKLHVSKRIQEQPQDYSSDEPEEAIRLLEAEAAAPRERLLRRMQSQPGASRALRDTLVPMKHELAFVVAGGSFIRRTAWIVVIMLAAWQFWLYVRQYVLLELEFGSYQRWVEYGAYPVISIVVIAVGLGLARLETAIKVRRLLRKVRERLEEQMDEQERISQAYTNYRNDLYTIIKLAQRKRQIMLYAKARRQENLKLRFHLNALDEAIERGQRLIDNWGLRLHDLDGTAAPAGYDERTWLEHDHTSHPAYHPAIKTGHTTNLVVNHRKDSLGSGLLYPAVSITCEIESALPI